MITAASTFSQRRIQVMIPDGAAKSEVWCRHMKRRWLFGKKLHLHFETPFHGGRKLIASANSTFYLYSGFYEANVISSSMLNGCLRCMNDQNRIVSTDML